MKVFLIHGAYGNPEENWFPWMKDKLEEQGHQVFVPKFPTPENQNLDNWISVMEPYLGKIDSDTIFVGHSLGPAFILSLLEKINIPIKACFFVAGWIGPLGKEEFDSINTTLVEKEFDWDEIKQNCAEFTLYGSDNDPYVPLDREKSLAKQLDSELILIEGAGHFNEKAGYTKFPRLLEDMEKV